MKHRSAMLLVAAAAAVTLAPAAAAEVTTAPAIAPPPVPAATAAAPGASVPSPTLNENGELTEIVIRAPEPRYVAPTRRDQIGRIWAPVYINGKGPFRMVLDSGASRSGVTARVASALGIPPDESNPVKLRAVTGSATVPTIHVNTLQVGDVLVTDSRLPILADALGGADGVLGNEGLADQRVYIDFRHDLIIISRSHGRPAAPGFKTVPFTLERGRLLVADVSLGLVHAKAIIDTGGQITVANMALRDALIRHRRREKVSIDQIEGVTNDIQDGEGRRAPPIQFGPIEIQSKRMTFADIRIFEYWKMTKEPSVLIGMDALGLLDTLIIDYRRRELMLRMRGDS
ncbi:MAG: clan AA aspartic protease [Gammaproteobacteria bacterium]|nr:clan AA aspartic protease [Gammaproteobacteria bacterium]